VQARASIAISLRDRQISLEITPQIGGQQVIDLIAHLQTDRQQTRMQPGARNRPKSH